MPLPENVATVAERLVASYAADAPLSIEPGHELPSPPEVAAVLRELRELLFPGYTGTTTNVGATLRAKQSELRLAKACELLAGSNAKVVDVALTSGFQSHSLFNLMFKKRFGLSPGKWRQRQGQRHARRQGSFRLLAR